MVQEVQQGAGALKPERDHFVLEAALAEVMTAEWAKHQLKDPEILQEYGLPLQDAAECFGWHAELLTLRISAGLAGFAWASLPGNERATARGHSFHAMSSREAKRIKHRVQKS